MTDPVAAAWSGLSARARAVLSWRREGETLEQVGGRLEVTRERARQIQVRATADLIAGVEALHWGARDAVLRDTANLVDTVSLASRIGSFPGEHFDVYLIAVGLRPALSWTSALDGWWSSRPTVLRVALETVVRAAPMSDDAVVSAASEALPSGLDVVALLDDPDSPLTRAGSTTRRASHVGYGATDARGHTLRYLRVAS